MSRSSRNSREQSGRKLLLSYNIRTPHGGLNYMRDQPPPGEVEGAKLEVASTELRGTGQKAGKNRAILTMGSNSLCHQGAGPTRRKLKKLLISHVTGQLYAVRILCWVALEVTMNHQRLVLTVSLVYVIYFKFTHYSLYLEQFEEDWLISENLNYSCLVARWFLSFRSVASGLEKPLLVGYSIVWYLTKAFLRNEEIPQIDCTRKLPSNSK